MGGDNQLLSSTLCDVEHGAVPKVLFNVWRRRRAQLLLGMAAGAVLN